MNRTVWPSAYHAVATPRLLIEAVRCWRDARDNGKSVQPHLFALLTQYGFDMLAPVIDSVMTLTETLAGRCIKTGKGDALSEDEHRLIGLVAGADVLPQHGGLARSLNCGLEALRILMRRVPA